MVWGIALAQSVKFGSIEQRHAKVKKYGVPTNDIFTSMFALNASGLYNWLDDKIGTVVTVQSFSNESEILLKKSGQKREISNSKCSEL